MQADDCDIVPGNLQFGTEIRKTADSADMLYFVFLPLFPLFELIGKTFGAAVKSCVT